MRRLNYIFIRSLVFMAALFSLTAFAEELPEKPNIIFIMADDLGYGDIGSFGQQRAQTPNLDKLAAQGIKFTQHYAGSAVCAPSRASLMTGQHTGHTQIRGNHELGGYRDEEERGQMPLKSGSHTLATVLKSAGYRTAAIGKWGLGGPGSEGEPQHHGFDYFFGYLDQKQAHNYYPTHLWRNGKRVPLSNEFFIPHTQLNGTSKKEEDYKIYMGNEYAPDRLIEEATDFIASSSDKNKPEQPFFLYMSFVTVHAALQTPDDRLPSYASGWQEPPMTNFGYTPHPRPRAARAAMISNMDTSIGRIMTLLKERNLDRNTLVIFTSDNGPSPEGGADMDFFNSSGELRGIKRDLYEGGIRVPMIARWSSRIQADTESSHISAFWDIMPTLAELSGAEMPADRDGISFVPSLLGKESSQEKHQALYWEFKLQRHDATATQAVRMGKWKALRFHRSHGIDWELYDLSTDIGEQHNLAKQFPNIIDEANELMKKRTKPILPEWEF
ncbi:MAG: arylsulfatase [Pseudoalteromonas nigrifaciens]